MLFQCLCGLEPFCHFTQADDEPVFLPVLAKSIYDGVFVIEYKKIFVKAIANLSLIQSWFPDEKVYFSFNSVSWFLSSIAFAWFVTPLLMKLIRRVNSKKKCILLMLFVAFFMFAIAFCLEKSIEAQDGFKKWLIYIFPPFRVLDFLEGALLGQYILKTKYEKKRFGKLAGYIFVIWSLLMIIATYKSINLLPISYACAVIWLPSSVALIYYVSSDAGGIFRKILSCKYLVQLGNVSSYLFLIHQIIVRVIHGIVKRVGCLSNFLFVFVLIEFLLSIYLAKKIDKYNMAKQ